MKTVEISDAAYDVIRSRAEQHASGDILAYVDRLVGIIPRREYEELPVDIEHILLTLLRPEEHSNAEVCCRILDLIQKRAPKRFETCIGLTYPDRDTVVLTRSPKESQGGRHFRRIGNSDVFLFVNVPYKQAKEMLIQILGSMGYSESSARALAKYVTKRGDAEYLANRYVS